MDQVISTMRQVAANSTSGQAPAPVVRRGRLWSSCTAPAYSDPMWHWPQVRVVRALGLYWVKGMLGRRVFRSQAKAADWAVLC